MLTPWRLQTLISTTIPFSGWTALSGVNIEGIFRNPPNKLACLLTMAGIGHTTNITQTLKPSFGHTFKGSHHPYPIGAAANYTYFLPLVAFFIRGLFAAWNATDPNSAVAKYIQGYINVQVRLRQLIDPVENLDLQLFTVQYFARQRNSTW